MLKQLDKIPYEIIRDFRKTGKSQALSEELQKFVIQLDRAAELHRIEPNITRCAKLLMVSPEGTNLALHTARARIYDAINFLHLNNTVKNEAWDYYFADKLEDLALVAIKAKNITEARRCMDRAHALRTNRDESAINPEDLVIKDQLISPDITSDRLGLEQFNLTDLWKEGTTLIQKFDITEKEKKTISKEFANAIDTEYEDVPD